MTKSISAPTWLMAQTLRVTSLPKRFEHWRSRIDNWEGKRCKALELYQGGHWSIVRGILSGKSGYQKNIRCCVISAGYGLVGMETKLAPYAATFAPGQADSVVTARGKFGPIQNVEWWRKLCSWRPSRTVGPRSIRGSFRKAPKGIHIFALSPFYLDAISEDLINGLSELSNPEKLIIISTGKKRHGDLNQLILPAPAKLQSILGGALVSLNVRLAAEILNRVPARDIDQETARLVVSDLLSAVKPRVIPQRRRLSDSAVSRLIRKIGKNRSDFSYTLALRLFRDAGNACEMKRFKNLFVATMKSKNDTTKTRS